MSKNSNIINFNLPVDISNFTKLENGRTLAKLRVMYRGETADGRIIDSFADSIKEQLPGCPVVAFYSSITEDFVGHNSTQYIYGVVNGAEGGFVTEDNVEWLETEVVLYTDRADTAEIASKIVGQPQSLELKNMKYEFIEKDGKRKMHIIGGDLIGLSVLGTKQRPAFTGASFFNEIDAEQATERFMSFISTFNEKNQEEQGEEMDQLKDFMEFKIQSYNELYQRVHTAIRSNLGDDTYFYIEDIATSNDSATINLYGAGYKRVNFTISEADEVIVNDSVEVQVYYLTSEEFSKIEQSGQVEEQPVTEEVVATEETTIEETNVEEVAEGANDESQSEKNFEATTTELQPEGTEGEIEVFNALNESERAELEELRKEKKISLINSFTELGKEKLEEFINKVDEFSFDELENELSKEFVKFTRLNERTASFSHITEEEVGNLGDFASIVKRYATK